MILADIWRFKALAQVNPPSVANDFVGQNIGLGVQAAQILC